RRNHKAKPHIRRWLAAAVVLLAAVLGWTNAETQSVLSVLEVNQPGMYQVETVVDGDTIEVDMYGVQERVRFIGVDTPEKNHPEKPVQCFAEAASAHLADLIGDQRVRLESDPTNQNRDRYNRLLRYVYLPDGTLLNAKQIEDGYGFAYTSFPFIKMDGFISLEAQARAEGRGLWRECEIESDNGYLNTNEA